MKLFEEMPCLESGRLIIRELKVSDADGIRKITGNEKIYRYLPAFLFERKYEDTADMISRIREECFDTKDSILLGICLKADPDKVIGIAEIYDYEEQEEKASIGCRLNEDYWHKGIASETARMLRDYLTGKTDCRKVIAYVMEGNAASRKALENSGFVCMWSGLPEDWGRSMPVTVCKYMYEVPERAE